MLDWIVALYLPFTCLTQGISLGATTLTPAAMLAVVGCILTCIKRIKLDRPIISLNALSQAPVFCSLAYFLVGVGSGIYAGDKDGYMKEVIQRTLIILMPLYLYIYGPSHPRIILRALIFFIPVAGLLALATLAIAVKTRLHEAVYLFGMHKNVVGADCAHLVIICAAFCIAGQFQKYRKVLWLLIGLGVLGMVGAQARAAITGSVLAVFLMMLANRVKVKALLALAIVAAAGFSLTLAVLPKEALEHVTGTQKFSSNAVRQYTWRVVTEKLQRDPLVCVGWGNPIFSYLDVDTNAVFAASKGMLVPDCANIFFYDWGQMGILGVVAQISMFASSLILGYLNARKCNPLSLLAAVNLAAFGIMCVRFEQAYLDTFWIGRGPTLAAWAAVGMVVFVRLWLSQSEEQCEVLSLTAPRGGDSVSTS